LEELLVLTLPLTLVFLVKYEVCLPKLQRLQLEVTNQDDSLLMLKVDAVKPAKEVELELLK
jgi:hypothetical protein